MRSGQVRMLEKVHLEGDSVLVGFRLGGIYPLRLPMSQVTTARHKVGNVAGTAILVGASVGAISLWWVIRGFSCRSSAGCT